MLRHLVAFCIASALAHDDQSLMQHQVGVEGSVAVFQNALQEISDTMAQMPPGGEMRQLAIESLMKSVGESTQNPDQWGNLLEQIEKVLEDLLSSFSAAASADQSAYDRTISDAAQCISTEFEAARNDLDITIKAMNTHDSCLTDARWRINNMLENTCKRILESMLIPDNDQGTGKFEHCHGTLGILTKGEELQRYFTVKRDNYEVQAKVLSDDKKACFDDYDHLQTGSCADLQEAYEKKLCSHKRLRAENCVAQKTCWNAANNAHKKALANAETNSKIRVGSAGQLKYVLCIVRKMRTNKQTNDVDPVAPCRVEADSDERQEELKAYNFTRKPAPVETACAVFPDDFNNILPGNSKFIPQQQARVPKYPDEEEHVCDAVIV